MHTLQYKNYVSSPYGIEVAIQILMSDVRGTNSNADSIYYLHRRRFTLFVSFQKKPVASCIGSSLQAQ